MLTTGISLKSQPQAQTYRPFSLKKTPQSWKPSKSQPEVLFKSGCEILFNLVDWSLPQIIS